MRHQGMASRVQSLGIMQRRDCILWCQQAENCQFHRKLKRHILTQFFISPCRFSYGKKPSPRPFQEISGWAWPSNPIQGRETRRQVLALLEKKILQNRLKALTEDTIMSYFDDLHNIISAERIWNMDETGLQFQHSRHRERPQASSVQVQWLKRNFHGYCLHRCCGMCRASTAYRQRQDPGICLILSFQIYLGPKNAMWTYQQKGWTENSLGVEWFKNVFLPNCGSSRPQLLLLESYSSHEVLELLEIAKGEKIHLFDLPPHTRQLLQSLAGHHIVQVPQGSV